MTFTRAVLHYLTSTGLKTHTTPVTTGGGGTPPDTTPPDALFTVTASTTSFQATVNGATSVAYGGRTITSYRWDFGDGTVPLQTTSSSAAHSYTAGGTYTVTLVVVDSGGLTSTPVTHRAIFAVAAPVARITVTTSGLTATYDASASTSADGTALTYNLDWGDGSAHSTGVTGSHTYALAGPWTATLVVTDIRGKTGTTTTSITGTAPSGGGGGGSLSRDPRYLPFTSDSPFNTAVGSGAVYGTKDQQYLDAVRGTSSVNASSWTVSVIIVSSTDPAATIVDKGSDGTNPLSDGTPTAKSFVKLASFHSPTAPVCEVTGPAPGGDTWTCIMQPSGAVQEISGSVTFAAPGTWSAGHASISNIYSDGLNQGRRASNTSNLAGLIRMYDLQKGVIQHALSMCLGADSLGYGDHTIKSQQYVWPASQVDSAWTAYYGNVPMGSLLAIPPATNPEGVDITTIRDGSGNLLSAGGLMLARCLQDYGGYVIARTNIAHGTLMAEYGSASLVKAVAAAWPIVRPYLRVVKNNSPTSVGGGGVPRQPALPPLV